LDATPKQIPIWRNVDAALFREQIAPLGQPAVLKDLVADWPVVEAAKRSPQALADYIAGFATAQPAAVVTAPAAVKGRFFYSDDLNGFNFVTDKQPLDAILAELMRHAADADPPAIAAQYVDIPSTLPGFDRANGLSLPPPSATPRIWIGNQVIVAAHFDLFENIACVAGGRRRFTLFPPEQVRNLYVGPMERTPAGTPISMVDFDAPNLTLYPRFEQAMASAQVADLEPGDAIYIPYLWWHHVRSLEPLNVLVNYWWNQADPDVVSPQLLMLLALISLRDLPPAYRQAWRGAFDHWIFQTDGDPTAHLPPQHRGALGGSTPGFLRSARAGLIRALGGQPG